MYFGLQLWKAKTDRVVLRHETVATCMASCNSHQTVILHPQSKVAASNATSYDVVIFSIERLFVQYSQRYLHAWACGLGGGEAVELAELTHWTYHCPQSRRGYIPTFVCCITIYRGQGYFTQVACYDGNFNFSLLRPNLAVWERLVCFYERNWTLEF